MQSKYLLNIISILETRIAGMALKDMYGFDLIFNYYKAKIQFTDGTIKKITYIVTSQLLIIFVIVISYFMSLC